jgi:hypothetical protein
MRFEIPLYTDTSSTNEPLKNAVTLLKHAAKLLEQGKNEGALLDIRKALTNHLLANWRDKERILDKSIFNDWINKSPTDARGIYEDILARIQEGLRASLKIIDKFAHDDNVSLKTTPLRKDVEFVYFSVAHIVRRLVNGY